MKNGRLFFLILTTACIALSAVSTPQKTVKPPVFSKLKMPPPLPDLVISGCRFEPQGQNWKAYATLLNSGNAGAAFQPGQVMAELMLRGSSFKYKSPLAGGYFLGAGQVVEIIQVVPSAPPGNYPATWMANPAQVVAEKNASNNSGACQLVVSPPPPLPDLVITHLSVQPSSGPPSTVFVLTITVANQGDATAAPSVNQIPHFTLDGHPYDFFGQHWATVTFTVNKSSTQYFKTVNPIVPGIHTFNAVVDSGNLLAEKNETNNTNTCTFTVTQ